MHTYLFSPGEFSVIQRRESRGTNTGFAIIPNNWQTDNIISSLLSEEEKRCILAEAVEYMEELIKKSAFGLEYEIILEAKKYVANLFNSKIIMY